MKKLYYKTEGQDPDTICVDPCPYKIDNVNRNPMIGSASCRDCLYCFGWDSEEDWIKCLKYSMEQQGLHVERKDANHV